MQRAIDEGWGRTALRTAIREATNPPADDPPPGDDGNGNGGDGLTISERIEQAALRCWNTAQPNEDGSVVVPPESWAALTAALGKE